MNVEFIFLIIRNFTFFNRNANFKYIAKAFDLRYFLITKTSEIKEKLIQIQKDNRPCLVEVITDPNQKIYGKEF